jgi:hypothetical protein
MKEEIETIEGFKTTEWFGNISSNNNNDDILTNGSINLLMTNSTAAKKSFNYSLSLKILDWINFYYLGAIIIIGILGNLKNSISFLTSQNKLRSPSYYLATLTFADLIFLVILLILWLNQFEIDLFSRPGIYQTFFYLSSASSCISGNNDKLIILHI